MDQPIGNIPAVVDRVDETDSLAGDLGRIDPGDRAALVHQPSSAFSRVDGGVRLNQVGQLNAPGVDRAVQGTCDPLPDGWASQESRGVSNCDDVVANPERARRPAAPAPGSPTSQAICVERKRSCPSRISRVLMLTRPRRRAG